MNQRSIPKAYQRARELRQEMTGVEQILWGRLRNRGLDGWKFRRQHPLGPFIVDFYCHAAGLVVELDGGYHQQQAEYDEVRDQVLAARGLRVLRIRNQEVIDDLPGVLVRIGAACGEAT